MSTFSQPRPIWSALSAIYLFIAGGLAILTGLGVIILIAPVADATQAFGGVLGEFDFFAVIVRNLLLVSILIGILNIGVGIFRIITGIGLNRLRPWARTSAIILHGLGALSSLGSAVFLLTLSLGFQALVPFLFFAAETTLAIGLLLPGTAQAFQRFGGSSFSGAPDRQTQIAPAPQYAPPPPVYAPPPLPPTQGVPAIQTPPVAQPMPNFPATEAATAGNVGGGGNYGRPGGVGVQKTELAQAEPQILAWLIERNGPRAGREHRLREQVTIGRDPARCEVVLDDGKVSGEHARIRLEKGQYVLYDLASTNHTFVNGQEVQKHVLRDGDQIRFGTNVTASFMLAGK
jgi:hypothetical protein